MLGGRKEKKSQTKDQKKKYEKQNVWTENGKKEISHKYTWLGVQGQNKIVKREKSKRKW